MIEIERINVPDEPTIPCAKRMPGDNNMTNRQLAFIEKLARECPLKRFLEVGVYKGTTTTMLAQIGLVVGVDWFMGNPEGMSDTEGSQVRLDGFLKTMRDMNAEDRIVLLTGKSSDILPLLKNQRFGLVLIDADHSYESALSDIRNIWPVLVPGGWVVLDDFSEVIINGKIEATVKQAWEQFRKDMNLGVKVVTSDLGLPKTVAFRK
jgi:predicted O-methyltransferase YrrM